MGEPKAERFLLQLPSADAAIALAGEGETTLRQLGDSTGSHLVLHGLTLQIQGKPSQVQRAARLVELLRYLWSTGEPIATTDLTAALSALDTGRGQDHQNLSSSILGRSQTGRLLRPRTLRQKDYVEAIEGHALTFAIGPAGTGKTLLATILAVQMLNARKVERLILTRPAVEAGERLGFLPGDLQRKVDPYLRPLYDALHMLLGQERTVALLEKGIIEVAPLAYMRGRTLSDAFIILDEAQNTSPAQMRMVLTRLGDHSRMVVTGDPSQADLPRNQRSGIDEARAVLKGVKGVAFIELSGADVVRHPLVQRIVEAYGRFDQQKRQALVTAGRFTESSRRH